MMKRSNQQTTRIRKMERCLVSASAAVKRLEAALDRYESVRQAIAALDEYYGSDLWRQDLADDEAGLLPENLKRGVLSQDAIWNLLTDVHTLTTRLRTLTYREHGLPTVKYCAQGLFLSPNYFGDLIKEITGDTAGNTIRRFVMKRAQQLLFSGCSVSQTADQLGFDYPQHFTRMFKKCYGMSPSDYLKQMRSK